VSFDPCQDCGSDPNYWIAGFFALVWAVPLLHVFLHRGRGDAWAADPKLLRAILFLMALTLGVWLD
jgi:hypothetical protein